MVQHYQTQGQVGVEAREFDAGLRKYMLGVYNLLTMGILLTGIIAMAVFRSIESSREVAELFFVFSGDYVVGTTTLMTVAQFGPLALILGSYFFGRNMSSGAIRMMFWAISACFGVSLSLIFLVYTGASIAKVFLITSAMFGALSLFGYSTKKNLGPMRTFLVMGLVGLIIASLVNMFWPLGGSFGFIYSVAGVLIFSGFTAYNTQEIKNQYYMYGSQEMMARGAAWGALSLYIDFINLFMFLLRLFGSRE